LAPAGLEAEAADGTPRAIPLDEATPPSPRRETWRRRGLAAAGTACAGLAIAAIALPFGLQSMALADAERQIEALAPRVAEAEALRRRMAEAKGGQDAFAAERARVGDALQAIAAITDILPDGTWLTELTLRQRKLGMAGRSAGAARLIGLLSADPTIGDAAFAAPVTRAEGTRAEPGGVDAFSIRAELRM
ncbi:PilN domain-containing protein, partial [Dankookia rubra]|uniref:PilN domain-containing protein n=1 Tax=Dankookia rubra TaxID=1442381 RepID=UPI00140E70B0